MLPPLEVVRVTSPDVVDGVRPAARAELAYPGSTSIVAAFETTDTTMIARLWGPSPVYVQIEILS